MQQVLSAEEQLSFLRDISGTIDEYIQGSYYVEDFGVDTDYTINDVLKVAYEIILEELSEFGIKFNIDEFDLLQDWYTAFHLYYLRKFVDSTNLISVIQNKAEFQRLRDLYPASEEDTEDDFKSFINYLLECEVEDIENDDEDIKNVTYLLPYIETTPRFRSHILSILDFLEETGKTIIMPEVELVSRWMKKMQAVREYIRKAYIFLSKEDPNLAVLLQSPLAQQILDRYDMDKVNQENIKFWALMEDPDYGNYLKPTYDKVVKLHHLRSNHHFEYWTIAHPDYIPHQEELLILVVHHYEPGSTKEEFIKGVKDYLLHLKDTPAFTKERLDFMCYIADLMLKIYPQEDK